MRNSSMKSQSGVSTIRARKHAANQMPLMIPFAQTRIAHPVKVTFEPPDSEIEPVEHGEFANPVAAFPSHVRLMNLGMVLLAGAMILMGALYMPGKQFATSWWHDSGGGTAAFILPSLLNHWQIVVGVVGILVVPLLKTQNRGRLALGLSVSLGVLLILSILDQRTVGISMVMLPLLGLTAMVILNAVLRARTLDPTIQCLKHWQLFAGLASAAIWSLPAYLSIHGGVMRQMLQTAGGPWVTAAFAGASLSGLAAGLLSTIDSGDKYSPLRNITTRFLSSFAIVVMGGCGLVLAVRLGQVSVVMHETERWFGAGLVWLALVINGCLLMAWSGLVERFGGVAVNRQGLPDHCHE